MKEALIGLGAALLIIIPAALLILLAGYFTKREEAELNQRCK